MKNELDLDMLFKATELAAKKGLPRDVTLIQDGVVVIDSGRLTEQGEKILKEKYGDEDEE